MRNVGCPLETLRHLSQYLLSTKRQSGHKQNGKTALRNWLVWCICLSLIVTIRYAAKINLGEERLVLDDHSWGGEHKGVGLVSVGGLWLVTLLRQTGSSESTQEQCWTIGTSKPISSDMQPSERPHFLILPKQPPTWNQTFKCGVLTWAILIQTTAQENHKTSNGSICFNEC